MLINDLETFAKDGSKGINAVSVVFSSGANAAFEMYTDDDFDTKWNGSGSFVIFLYCNDNKKVYLYTDGSTIESINYIPTYTITSSTANYTIPFSAFKVVDGETIPNAPFGLVTTGATVNSISLSWSSLSSNATGFRVYRSSSANGTYTQVGTTTGTTYTDTGLTANTTYYYKVAAYNGAGTSPQSSYVYAVTLSNTTNSITITGTPKVGQTLTATSTGTGWTSSSYFWGYASKEDANSYTIISGATGSTFTVSSTYTGRYIRAFRLHPSGDWTRSSDGAKNYGSNFLGPMQP